MYNDFVARLTLKLLGASHIALDEQPITYFRSINVQGILIYLALHPTQPVSRDVLATLFWPVETESRARANLRQSLYQLRLLLGDMNSPERPFLLVTRHTAQLNPECDYTVDVQQFLGEIENHDLATAESIYHGDLLPGFTCDSAQFEDWLRQERQNLHHLAMAAMHELAQDHLQAGHLDEAQSVARRQLGFEPWCEPAHRQLMRAHALAGDRANALAQYEACRKALDEELGVAPAAETVALFEDIKKSRIGPMTTGQAIQPPRRIKHNLPAETAPLIGRELELAQINNLFTRYGQRLVTIVGPGGVGKTRLALAAGYALAKPGLHEPYPDGIYFVDVAPLEQAREIPAAISASMDFQPPDKPGDVFPQLLDFLSRRKILLVLDNFEHLLDGVATIDDIMKACSDVATLVTSRQRLNMAAESRFDLGGLDYPDSLTPKNAQAYTAVQLFVDSGRRVQPRFDLNETNITGVIRICQLVQGMPLGLILAAAWLELLSPVEIAAEIEARLDFLAVDLADLPPRQRSMQAIFERSWDMLAPEEQAVLARLSVFRGGFMRDVAGQVAGANLRILLSLVSKSLLQRRDAGGRFEIHELLRQYAASKLSADPTHEQEVRGKHSAYFCAYLQERETSWFGPRQKETAAEVRDEIDNIQRAWRWALSEGAWESISRAINSLSCYHEWWGLFTDGESLCRAIATSLETLPRKQPGHYSLWSTALAWQGLFANNNSIALEKLRWSLELLDRPELARQDRRREKAFVLRLLGGRYNDIDRAIARRFTEESLRLYRGLDDAWGTGVCLSLLARLDWGTGQYALAREKSETALTIFRELGDRRRQIEPLTRLGWLEQHLGDLDAAESLGREALDLCRQLDDRASLARNMADLAYIQEMRGEFAEALETAGQALNLCQEYGLRNPEGYIRLCIGAPALYAGQYERAHEELNQALSLVQEAGDYGYESHVHIVLGDLALAEGAGGGQAREHYKEAHRLAEAVQDNFIALALIGLGYAACRAGTYDEARRHFLDSLVYCLELGDAQFLAWTLPGVALYLVLAGDVERAVEIWELARCWPYVGNSRWHRDVVGKAIEAPAALLPPEIIEAAIKRGRALDQWETAEALLDELDSNNNNK